MAKAVKPQVKNIYKAKEEKLLAEAFQNKIAQMISWMDNPAAPQIENLSSSRSPKI